MFRKWLRKAGFAMAVLLCANTITAYAAPDWNQIESVETGSSHSNLQKVQAAYDESNLYVRITGGSSNPYDALPQLQVVVNQKELEGNLNRFVLICDNMQEGENVIQVKDAWWQDTKAQGTLIRTSGVNEMEVTIPLSVIGYEAKDVSEIVINAFIFNKKEAEFTAKSLIPEPEVPEEPEQDGIILDGDFTDWNKHPLTYGGRNGIGKVSIVSDGTDAYILIVEDGSFDHSFQQGGAPIGLTSNMGKKLWLNAQMKNTGEKIELSFTGLEMAQGVGAKADGVFHWEIKLPLSEVWQEITSISELRLIWSEDNEVIMTAVNPSYTDPGGSGGDLEVGGELVIDGYYEDWNRIPHMEITYGGNNKANSHLGALYMGKDYIYGHYKMNRLYTSYIQVHSMQFRINGDQYMLQMLPVDGRGDIDWSASNNKLENGIYTNYAVFLSGVPGSPYHYNQVGQGAITIYDSNHSQTTPGDEVEFSVNFQRLEELIGIKQSEIREVKLRNPNIGHEWLVCAGTSSGPLAGVMLSIGAAVFIYWGWNQRNRKKEGKRS